MGIYGLTEPQILDFRLNQTPYQGSDWEHNHRNGSAPIGQTQICVCRLPECKTALLYSRRNIILIISELKSSYNLIINCSVMIHSYFYDASLL